MNRQALNLKCPICGAENKAVQFDIECGWTMNQIRVKYECNGVRKRPFRKPEPCTARYTITLYGDQAEELIQRLHVEQEV